MDQPSPAKFDALSAAAQERLAEILEQYLAELEAGRRPDLAAWTAEHPELAEHLTGYAQSLEFLQRAAGGLAQGERRESAAELPLGQLGDYQIVREIGRGGMGLVYEARQLSLDRQVALKVLPLAGLLDPKQIARFQQEARAAAGLHHPHIVPIFCVGCERGVHYYAMQYIAGQSLDALLEALREGRAVPQAERSAQPIISTMPLLPDARYYRRVAELGVEAAEALQHAHDYGVIHRDIKPSNLLLDAQGKLWITDFGLARTHVDAGLTVTGDVLGTLRYMSPEQAAGNASLIDPRTDVYGLGATLYELLTLRPVFSGHDRAVLLQGILQDEPQPPRQIAAHAPVDLETIVLKALSKTREGRYATAQELADDLRRFLESKPTLARRPSLAARVGKWARRYRVWVTAAGAVAALAVLGLVVGSLLVLGEHARTRAALARAEKHYHQARRVVDRFAVRQAEQLARLPGAEPLRRELLADTLGYYQEFIALAGRDPTLLAELATTQFKAAGIQRQLGDSQQALSAYRDARERFEQLANQAPDDPRRTADLALCENNLGLALAQQGHTAQAEAAYRQAASRQREIVDRWPDHADAQRFRSDLAVSYGNLALLESQAGRVAAAERSHQSAIALQQELVRREPGEPRYAAQLATSYNNLSFLYARRDAERARQFCQQALAVQRRLTAERPQEADYQSDLALSWNNLGALENSAGDGDAARAAYREAVAILRCLVRKAPAVLAYRRDLAVSLNNLGRGESLAEERSAAQTAFQEARGLLADLVRDDPQEVSYRSDLGGVLNNLAMILEHRGRAAEAAPLYAEAITHQRWACQRAPAVLRFREFLAQQYVNYGRALRVLNRNAEAAQAARELEELGVQTAAKVESTEGSP